jgi:hypothetical protein
MEPIREGVVDLRNMRHATSSSYPQKDIVPDVSDTLSVHDFVRKYRLFFGFVLLVIGIGVGLWLYLSKVLVPGREYHIKDIQSQSEVIPQ